MTRSLLRRLPLSIFRPVDVAVPVAPSRRRASRTALAAGLVSVVALFAGTRFVLDVAAPNLRDPEYGRRLTRYQARVGENPGRPVVAVLGSSRVSMGVRMAAWEESRPADDRAPLVFNMGLVGSGPVMQVMCLRRLLADGPVPDAVLVEFWPPFLWHRAEFFEVGRIDRNRLRADDTALVRDYFPEPDKTLAEMRAGKLNPVYETRQRLLAQINPRWLPWTKRVDAAWENLDPYGWLPGLDAKADDPVTRQSRVDYCHPQYKDHLAGLVVSPDADRAVRETIALARSRGCAVGLAYLPESSEFRSWYSAAANERVAAYLASIRAEYGLPLIDARTWMADVDLADGFHLNRTGAAAFSRRFGPAVAATFPGLTRR